MTKSSNGSSVRQELRQKLIGLINAGTLKPGEKLREEHLAKRLKVSRTPLREALFMLQAEGLVTAKSNSGFSVATLSRAEAEELYPVVGELEAMALGQVFGQARTLVEQLTAINNQFLAARLRPVRAKVLDQQFHSLLLGSCSNKTLRAILAGLHQKLARYEACYMTEEALVRKSYGYHQAIISALNSGQKARAMEELRDNWIFGLHAFLARNPAEIQPGPSRERLR